MNTKFCSKCYISHPIQNFVKDAQKKDGYRSSCKDSNKFIKQQHYLNNKNKYRQSYVLFIQRNPNYQVNYKQQKLKK